MKLLLTLPLLALAGLALAEDSFSRNCVNGKCIECRNGVCHEARKREAAEDSSSKSCTTVNGHETCTICTNGACHTTSSGKRAARKVCHDGDCQEEPGKREASEENTSSTNCVNNVCHVCVNGVCHTTGGKRSAEEQNNCFYQNGQKICGKKRSAEENDTSTTCYNGSCTVCINGVCHITGGKKREATEEQNSASSNNCIDYRDGRGCVPIGKRASSEDSSSESCTSVNGHKTCTICRNGACHTTSNGKREASEDTNTSTNCVNNVCHVCVNGVCHTTGGKKREATEEQNNNTVENSNCMDKGDGRGCVPFKKRAARDTHTKNCTNGHCIECINGNCQTTQSRKREEQNINKNVSCTNGQCTECINGNCRTYHE